MAQVSDVLLRALESDDPCELQNLIKEGKREDFEALQSLVSLDPSVKPEQRRKAIYALGRWGDPGPVDAIRRLLPDLDEAERIAAIDSLGRLGTKEALEGVLDCAADASPQVRKFVVRALGRIDMPEAQEKLKEIAASDETEYVRSIASKQMETRQKR